MRTSIAAIFAISLGLSLVACGSKPPPPVKAPDPEPPRQESHGPKLQMQSELGQIDEQEIQKTFTRIKNNLLDCHKKGLERVAYLQGDIKFFMRIDKNGKVRWTYLEDSSLGDRDTEKCMLDVVANAQWPKPEGGEAEVRSATGFDPPSGRPPAVWSPDKIAAVVAKESPSLGKCKMPTGRAHVTLYVKGHGKHGKVQAVGMSLPVKDAEKAIECAVDEIATWQMPSPGSWAAKVSFDL